MDTMKIEITEGNGKNGHAIVWEGMSYFNGDQRTVPKALGELFCSLGWARDIDGNVETGARDTSPKQLDVENTKIVAG